MSMERVLELKQKRANLIHDARALLDKADEEKRSLSNEEDEQYNRMDEDIDKLSKDIERMEKQVEMERQLGERQAEETEKNQEKKEEKRTLTDVLQDRSISNIRDTEEYREAFTRFLSSGSSALAAEEMRAMQVDSDEGGGYLVTPQQMVMQLLKEVDDQVYIRQFANVQQLNNAASLGVPTLEDDAADWDWTAELKTGSETDIEFGKRELRPYPLAKRVKVSNTLLRLSQMGPEAIVRSRLAYKLGITQEKAYLTGNGDRRPLGVFTASDDGIGTDRDVDDDMEQASITADGLINVKYDLKPQYWNRARWFFHRDAVKQIRKLKDGEGQYIWQAGLQAGQPDRILDFPMTMSEHAPNTFSAGNYVGILGDFRYYWIVDALNMQMQRLVELYAENNQTGFIARYEGDGAPILSEAFRRVKLAD